MQAPLSNLKRLATLAEHSDVYRNSERLAVIDMGSNSFRLIVVEYVPQLSFRVVDEVQEIVRLSEGMASAGIMRASAMDRASHVMKIYAAFCAASGITDIVAVGTSAIRDAQNQQRFLARIQAETGIQVRVLSGDEEAFYGYLSAVNSTTLETGFAVDLGGGSLEITRVEGRRMKQTISLPLGTVRTTEGFLTGDPPSSKQVEQLTAHLQSEFAPLDWFKREPEMMLIGIGGTLRMVGRMVQKMVGYPMDDLHGYTITLKQVETICDELAKLRVNARKRIPGMKSERADISLGGAMVIREVMRAAGFDAMTICGQGMREGVFYERFFDESPHPPTPSPSGRGGEKPIGGDGNLPIFENVRQASVLNLAHVHRFQEQHAEHIAHLTLSMFDQLPHPDCGPVERELLWAASMLHDIGVAIDYQDHHRHSAYLILNAGLPGYTHREIGLIALMARYHRRGNPSLDELEGLMEAGDNKRLLQLVALLRIAEQIDRSRDGVVRNVTLTVGDDWAQMEMMVRGDGQVAMWSVERNKDIFQQAFGLELEVVLIPEMKD